MKEFIKKLLPEFVQDRVRRYIKQRKAERNKRKPLISLGDLRNFIVKEMRVETGDTLFVHSGMTELKVEATPKEIVAMLIELVGEHGNLLMPFYPLKGSYAALLSGKPFDLRERWTLMGLLPIALAATTGAKKSLHPTKSVVAWGKDRDFLIKDHHASPMPYGYESPYYRISTLENSKVIGLGVTAARLSCMHVGVDITEDYPIQPYHPQAMTGKVIDYDGTEIEVITYAHNLEINNGEDVPRFLKETNCPTYKNFSYKDRPLFCVDSRAVIQHTIEQAKRGNTFFYPRRLNNKQPKRIPVS